MFTIMRYVHSNTQVPTSEVKLTVKGHRRKISSISPVLTLTSSIMEGFWKYFAQMFITMSRCEKLNSHIPVHKVKVTIRGNWGQ